MKNKMIPWRKRSEELSPERSAEHPFDVLHREIDDLFDICFRGVGKRGGWSSPLRSDRAWGELSPEVEVSETDEEVCVKAGLPGLDEKDIEVTVDENVLTLSGEKKEQREEKKRNCLVSEMSYGRFQRTIPLPAAVDRDRAKAKYKHGVLTITLPKTDQVRAARRSIPVSCG